MNQEYMMGCTHSKVIQKEKVKKTKLETDESQIRIYQSTVQHCNIEPHFFVLNIDFDTGHGLQEVIKLIKGGSGRVIGTETTKKKIKIVTKLLHDETSHGSLELAESTSEDMPFITDMFECVFTVNGVYHWMNAERSIQEIYRVLRPGCLFLTCLQDFTTIKTIKPSSQNKVHSIDKYIDILKEIGFMKVRIQEHRDAVSGSKYHIIKAFTPQRKNDQSDNRENNTILSF